MDALVAHANELPDFADIDPEVCYLTWTITLTTELPSEAIRNVLDWAEADCQLRTEEPTQTKPQILPVQGPPPPPAINQAPAGDAGGSSGKTASADSNSIRVAIEKLDELMNTVGEIVIAQSMLMQLDRKSVV